MADFPAPSSAQDPSFNNSSEGKSHPRLPLQPNSFTGMVNNSPEAVERRYNSSMSTYGSSNAPSKSKLYTSRLEANQAVAADSDRGYNAWNKRRQEAIERGEDPNSEFFAKQEERLPDSFLERGWRRLTGKGKTKKEEREKRQAKEAAKNAALGGAAVDRESEAKSVSYNGVNDEREQDGIIR